MIKTATEKMKKVHHIAATAKAKKVAVDFPRPLYEELKVIVREMHTTTSRLIRDAVENYVEAHHRRRLERQLEAGYAANAQSALNTANDMMSAEAELA